MSEQTPIPPEDAALLALWEGLQGIERGLSVDQPDEVVHALAEVQQSYWSAIDGLSARTFEGVLVKLQIALARSEDSHIPPTPRQMALLRSSLQASERLGMGGGHE